MPDPPGLDPNGGQGNHETFTLECVVLHSQQPTVSNVRAEQVAGSKTVEIRYNLAVDGGDSANLTFGRKKERDTRI